MKSGDMPAMPVGDARSDWRAVNDVLCGLTKREHFAAIAMQSLINTTEPGGIWHKTIAKEAVEYADALLAALENLP